MFSYFFLLQATAPAGNVTTADKTRSAKKRSSSQVIILSENQNQNCHHYQ